MGPGAHRGLGSSLQLLMVPGAVIERVSASQSENAAPPLSAFALIARPSLAVVVFT
jgi:hypothetical protein